MYFGINERHRGEVIMQLCIFFIFINVKLVYILINFMSFEVNNHISF